MSDINVVFAPSSKLKKKSVPVKHNEFGPDLAKRFEVLARVMYGLGGVGISGVQIGDMRRILVLDPQDGKTGLIKMANPVIVSKSDDKTITFSESCISLPEFEVDVERSRFIEVEYYDSDGNMHLTKFDGLNSVIVQHEIDHLNGVTLLDKVSRLKRDIYIRKVKKTIRKLKKAQKKSY